MPSDQPARFVANSAAVLTTQLAARLLAFGVFLVLARALPPAEFGQLVLVVASTELLRQLLELGLGPTAVLTLAAQPRALWPRIQSCTLRLRMALALVGAGLVSGLVRLLPLQGPYPALADWVSMAVVAGTITAAVQAPFQAALTMARPMRVQLAVGLAYLLTVQWGARAGWPLDAFLLAYVVQELVLAAGITALAARHHRGRPEYPLPTPVPLLRRGLPIGVLGLTVLLGYRLDLYLIEHILGAASVGLFGVGARISEALLILPIALSGSLFPYFAAEGRIGHADRSHTAYAAAVPLMLLSGALVATGCTALAPLLLPTLFPRAVGASALLPALAWSAAALYVSYVASDRLVARGATWPVLAIASGKILLKVLVSLWLIPRLGLTGAAISTLVAEAANAAGLLLAVRWVLGDGPHLMPGTWLTVGALAFGSAALPVGHPLVRGLLLSCAGAVALWQLRHAIARMHMAIAAADPTTVSATN